MGPTTDVNNPPVTSTDTQAITVVSTTSTSTNTPAIVSQLNLGSTTGGIPPKQRLTFSFVVDSGIKTNNILNVTFIPDDAFNAGMYISFNNMNPDPTMSGTFFDSVAFQKTLPSQNVIYTLDDLSIGTYYIALQNYGTVQNNFNLIVGDSLMPLATGNDYCNPDPCHGNGMCVTVNQFPQCKCNVGWVGSFCGTQNVNVNLQVNLPGGAVTVNNRSPGTILGLNPTIFYAIVGGVSGFILLTLIGILVIRRLRTKTMSKQLRAQQRQPAAYAPNPRQPANPLVVVTRVGGGPVASRPGYPSVVTTLNNTGIGYVGAVQPALPPRKTNASGTPSLIYK